MSRTSEKARARDYLDGVEDRVLALLRAAPDVSAATAIAAEAYGHFPIRYHLCPDRSILLRPFCFQGLRVLELGAGMGGVSRHVAEQCAHLTVVEGTAARMEACRERLRDLSNWTSHVSTIQDFTTDERFDAVLLIGVLEYAAYMGVDSAGSAFDTLLAKATSLLTEDGVLFVAIENELGLKYWAGASEDHSARRFDGIAGYADRPVPRTFSRKELRALLENAGLAAVREYFPSADYKVPHSVLSLAMLEAAPAIAADVMCLRPAEDYAQRRQMLFPDALGLETVSKAGLLPEFANSFLFAAARDAHSPTLGRLTAAESLGEIGWHYTLGHRDDPTVTTFYSPATSGGAIEVSKARLFADRPLEPLSVDGHAIAWRGQARSPAGTQPSMLSRLRRLAYYGDWPAFESLLGRFLEWSFQRWDVRDGSLMQGGALDAIVSNTLCHDGKFSLFDLEWEWNGDFPRSWFILRNILALHEIRQGSPGNFPHASLGAWYAALCLRHGVDSDLERDLDRELALQERIRMHFDRKRETEALTAVFAATLPCIDTINDGTVPVEILETRLSAAQAEIAALRAAAAVTAARLASRPYRWAARLMALRQRYPALTAPLRRLFITGERLSLHAGVLALCTVSLLLTMALMPERRPMLRQFAEMQQSSAGIDLPTFVDWSATHGDTPQHAQALFQRVDTNHDGRIDFAEWRAYVQGSRVHR